MKRDAGGRRGGGEGKDGNSRSSSSFGFVVTNGQGGRECVELLADAARPERLRWGGALGGKAKSGMRIGWCCIAGWAVCGECVLQLCIQL